MFNGPDKTQKNLLVYFKKSPFVGRSITDAGAWEARTNGYGNLEWIGCNILMAGLMNCEDSRFMF
jgi:hypothetical protein